MNYEEWFQKAAQVINSNIVPGESFLVRNLFQGQEWEALSSGDRKSFGRYFSSAIKDGRLKDIERYENAKGRQNQYIKKVV